MCFTFPISVGSLTCFLNINAFELCFLVQSRSTITCINNNYFPSPSTSFTDKCREGNIFSCKGYYNTYPLVYWEESYSILNILLTQEIRLKPFYQGLFHPSVLFGCFYPVKHRRCNLNINAPKEWYSTVGAVTETKYLLVRSVKLAPVITASFEQ